MLMGNYVQALEMQTSAESMFRTLRQTASEPLDLTYELSSLLYAKASCLGAEGYLDEALAALEESLQGYTALRDAGHAGSDRFIIDVRVRSARIRSAMGHGASAVVELDAAITTLLRQVTPQGTGVPFDDLLDQARILSMNAQVLCSHGDPELALASADRAITLYFSHARELNATPQLAHMHAPYLRLAARIAVDIHVVYGRLDIAIQAASIFEQVARSIAQSEQPADVEELVVALTWMGLIAQARGGGAEAERFLAEARARDARVSQSAEARWQAASARPHPLMNTLSTALEVAARLLGPERVSEVRQAGSAACPPGGTAFTPSARWPREQFLPMARQLAGLATELLSAAPEAARRLGLEAHCLYAVSSWELPWARLQLGLSRSYRDAGDLPMAVDLADGGSRVARQLALLTHPSPALQSLLAELERHRADLDARMQASG
jgi:tetratricopeptide (TPR) repeat protein